MQLHKLKLFLYRCLRKALWAFSTLLFWTLFSKVALAEVTQLNATIDKNPVLLDESVMLQITAVGGAERDAIDFSILTKDFRVSQPSVSQSTQIINFDRTTTTSWTLQLFPRETGTFTIPSFSIDGKSSEPIRLEVLPVSDAARTQPREFFVTTQVNDSEVFLQQQLQYTVKIHLAADIQRGSLSEPVLDGAVIEQLGDDKEYQEVINGVRYRVIERNFAVLPQASGEFTIDGPVFQAEVLTNTRQSFAFFNRTKTISRVAPPQSITVLPIPQDYRYTWLPSEQVQLSEQWQLGNNSSTDLSENEFVVGEPVTRTVTLTAMGLMEEQLPEIDAQYHPSFKTYPEQGSKATVERDNRLIAQLVQSTAVIPSEAGDFVLPEIRVPWFDVRTGDTRFAILPARSVKVIEASGNANTQVAPASNINTDSSDEAFESDEQLAQDDDTSGVAETAAQNRFPTLFFGFDILHAILLFLLVIAIVIVFILQKQVARARAFISKNGATNGAVNGAASHSAGASVQAMDEAQAWQQLNQALQSQNLGKVQHHLRIWLGYVCGKPVTSITATLKSLDAKEALAALNNGLSQQYSSAPGTSASGFDTQVLKQALEALRVNSHNGRQAQTRTSMYPL
uniref:BatD family protein n=1 Tax=Ningiella ruwaisensis TaxID=2364274 RepID=UPI00109F3B34|nr:BatD family protein [Ningiella ruwaisensis]